MKRGGFGEVILADMLAVGSVNRGARGGKNRSRVDIVDGKVRWINSARH